MDKMKMESVDLTVRNIDKIAALFPNCITETADENGKLKKAINFDMLRVILSNLLDTLSSNRFQAARLNFS